MDFVIAVDGTAASGKGTIAEGLAARYGLPYLDTGLLYRAAAQRASAVGADLDDAAAVARAARDLDPVRLEDPALRSAEAGEAASRIAAHPAVREALLALQQAFARRPGGAVLDGRDIGTVIAPQAPCKLYVDAAIEERARRRWLQTSAGGDLRDLEAVMADLRRRDARDSGRAAAPLRRASDAVLLETSGMSISEAADAARRIVEASRARWLEIQKPG
jgi:cytidylate kinase